MAKTGFDRGFYRPDKQQKSANKRGKRKQRKGNQKYSADHVCQRCARQFKAFASWVTMCRECYEHVKLFPTTPVGWTGASTAERLTKRKS